MRLSLFAKSSWQLPSALAWDKGRPSLMALVFPPIPALGRAGQRARPGARPDYTRHASVSALACAMSHLWPIG